MNLKNRLLIVSPDGRALLLEGGDIDVVRVNDVSFKELYEKLDNPVLTINWPVFPDPIRNELTCECGKWAIAPEIGFHIDHGGLRHARIACGTGKFLGRPCACGEFQLFGDDDHEFVEAGRAHGFDECDPTLPDDETNFGEPTDVVAVEVLEGGPIIESQPDGYVNWARVATRLEERTIDEFHTWKKTDSANQTASTVMRKYAMLRAAAEPVDGEPETSLIRVTRYNDG